jgi:hypothetical protein
MLFRVWLVLGMLALFGAAFANSPVMLDYGLLPANGLDGRHALDSQQPDTIKYDNGTASAFQPQTNYWIYQRFTTPATFQLISVYFVTINGIGNQAPCSLYVMTLNGTQPGTVLANWRVNGPLPNFAWNDTNLPDTVTIAANTDFAIVMGPVPGGPQAQGWHPLLDNSPVNTRAAVAFTGGRLGTYQYVQSGYWLVRAGGIIGDAFYDLRADEVWGTNSDNHGFFNVEVGETIQLHAKLTNVGNRDIPNCTVAWAVEGPGGSNVYTDDVLVTGIARNAQVSADAPATFDCATAGEYFVTCTIANDSDANAENDVTYLRLYAGGNHRWYRYDDNQVPESSVGFSDGNGWGVGFTPTAYPASVESIRVGVQAPGNGDFRIYLNGADGLPTGDPVWSSTPACVAGWNSFAVNPPVTIFEGAFTIAYLYQDPMGLGKDENLPNCAGIPDMQTVAFQASTDGTEWAVDESGNWCLQAWVDTSSALPPFAVMRWSPDTLQFGSVDTTGTTSAIIQLWFMNDGGQDPLHITQLQLTPSSIRSAYTFNPTTLTVEAGDSDYVTVTFNPSGVRNYNGLLAVTNDSHNASDLSLLVRGAGVPPQAAEVPSGELPTVYSLEQNYPNPFNPTTEIRFALPGESRVVLTVYNLVGQEVRRLVDGNLSAGAHTVSFDGRDLPSGLYYYRIEANDFTAIRKMLLLK